MVVRIVETFAETRRAARDGAGTIGLVPTMGYLHEGHLSLISATADIADLVVVSLFVNPLQFDDGADLAAYPADLGRDAELAKAHGADVLFAPSVAEMYPEPPVTTVTVRDLTDRLEGAHRPGHFDGVATVVTKLLCGLRPDVASFGRKDAQQLAVVRRLVADLSIPVDIRGLPTVREADGLALSSRNVRLPADARADAVALSRGLFAAADAIEAGERTAAAIERIAEDEISRTPGIGIDYVALVSQDRFAPVDRLDRPAVLATAATVGGVRLIDNVHIDVVGDRFVVDRGRRLERRSVLYEEEPCC